jgi:hypothetical protein
LKSAELQAVDLCFKKYSSMNSMNFYLQKTLIAFIALLMISGNLFSQKKKGNSEWVYPGKNGKLIYKTTPEGDKIMDFSSAGYMGGGVALPIVPATLTVQPSEGVDNTKLIQDAIDAIAAMPLKNGFRGAVQLAAGMFTCNETITISASGIVLRGSGSGAGGTTIMMTGSKHSAIVISNRGNFKNSEFEKKSDAVFAKITDAYVPSGAATFSVDNASQFSVGDRIAIQRPVTDSWVHFMGMDNLVRDGKPQTWIGKSRNEVAERKIIAISGNRISINIPLSDSYDAKYLNPSGTVVRKMPALQRITQVGIENLHVQCPPLEIAYGRAPYSGIRIEGDHCWVKDVYFEETMNTTTLAGNHITMQQVIVKHTYPNLGASKPTDFSIEGSGNLIDRCEVTGGNTYFVWTGSLETGPNVVLNSVFRGHGSRIQPHQRWSTGLLVDNCVVPDGGIDFMNRGVAGSGHGWTMGWAVAWNCIAKTYIIQNPPGVMNWAIGCVGTREQTARLFDTAPILAEGTFDSHGKPVALQSLYLAQLAERLGSRALKNIGYASYAGKMVTDQNIAPLPPQKIIKDPVLGADLAMHRPVNVSNVRDNKRQFGGEKALDGMDATYWATNDGVTKASFEVDTEGPLEINALIISEANNPGQNIRKYKIEGQVDSDWKLLSEGTVIDTNKVVRFPKVTVWKVRVTILDAENYAAIGRVSLYLDKKTN